jgi:hypothetical protein
MKEPRINVAVNVPLSMYQWLAQAADKSERTVGQEAKARLMEIFLRENDERRKHNRPTTG